MTNSNLYPNDNFMLNPLPKRDWKRGKSRQHIHRGAFKEVDLPCSAAALGGEWTFKADVLFFIPNKCVGGFVLTTIPNPDPIPNQENQTLT